STQRLHLFPYTTLFRSHNVYGPTEATIDTTWWMCQPTNTYNERHIVPIGRPIANAQVYLLDRSMQMVPVGVPGEIYVGGMGLARSEEHTSELQSRSDIV